MEHVVKPIVVFVRFVVGETVADVHPVALQAYVLPIICTALRYVHFNSTRKALLRVVILIEEDRGNALFICWPPAAGFGNVLSCRSIKINRRLVGRRHQGTKYFDEMRGQR